MPLFHPIRLFFAISAGFLCACGTNESVHLKAVPPAVDLVAVTEPGSSSHTPAIAHGSFDFTVTIRNSGGIDARSFFVDLFVGHLKVGHVVVERGLSGALAMPVTFRNVRAGAPGTMILTIVVDAGHQVDEIDETNNHGSYTVSVEEGGAV